MKVEVSLEQKSVWYESDIRQNENENSKRWVVTDQWLHLWSKLTVDGYQKISLNPLTRTQKKKNVEEGVGKDTFFGVGS